MIALIFAIMLDLVTKDPMWLPHPVRWIGRLIAFLEKVLYGKSKKTRVKIIRGLLLWLIVTALTVAVTALVSFGAYRLNTYVGIAVETVLTTYALAAGSLCKESMKVFHDLSSDDINAARLDLSMIVGRDTASLDESGVIRASVETVAENTSDGVMAPLLFAAFLGPAGAFLYKAVNTMDSMIGYRNERYEYFGKFAARADDLFNLIPSRISAVMMIVSSFLCGIFSKHYSGLGAAKIWWRDRYKHKSPNSAMTESVCAGALSVRLGGSSTYGGRIVDKPYIGDDIRPVENDDIKRANTLMFVTEAICTAAIFIPMILISISR